VPIGVDIEKISAAVVEKNRSVMKVMFVRSGTGKKGPLYAAKAYALVAQKHKNLELHVIGDGPYCAPVKKLLSGAGVLDRCVFHGISPWKAITRSSDTWTLSWRFRDHGNGDTEGARRWW